MARNTGSAAAQRNVLRQRHDEVAQERERIQQPGRCVMMGACARPVVVLRPRLDRRGLHSLVGVFAQMTACITVTLTASLRTMS
jgi:hypothetical protein